MLNVGNLLEHSFLDGIIRYRVLKRHCLSSDLPGNAHYWGQK